MKIEAHVAASKLIEAVQCPFTHRHCCVQAVKATTYTEKGNVSLGKAIKASGSASNLLIWFIIFFAAAILFFDWFHS